MTAPTAQPLGRRVPTDWEPRTTWHDRREERDGLMTGLLERHRGRPFDCSALVESMYAALAVLQSREAPEGAAPTVDKSPWALPPRHG